MLMRRYINSVTSKGGLKRVISDLRTKPEPGPELCEPDGGVCPTLRTTVVSVCQGAAHLDERTGQTLIDHHSVSNISWRIKPQRLNVA